jgi:GAF domain-containing protein
VCPDAQSATGGAPGRDRAPSDERALERIATLVAQGAAPDDVFAAVADEVSRLLGVPAVTVGRFEPDRTITVLAAPSAPGFEVGRRRRLDGASVSATILDTGRPARGDYHPQPVGGDLGAAARATGIRSVVAVPVILDGAVWGLISAVTRRPRAARGLRNCAAARRTRASGRRCWRRWIFRPCHWARFPLDGPSLAAEILDTGLPFRIDD